jgi:hypothetical protein
MKYDPHRPHQERFLPDVPNHNRRVLKRMRADALTLCKALGYDLNSVEFAVQDGVPYAIDFMNPAPDADLNSIGADNFEWIVEAVANLAIRKAKLAPQGSVLQRQAFLKGSRKPGPRRISER